MVLTGTMYRATAGHDFRTKILERRRSENLKVKTAVLETEVFIGDLPRNESFVSRDSKKTIAE